MEVRHVANKQTLGGEAWGRSEEAQRVGGGEAGEEGLLRSEISREG